MSKNKGNKPVMVSWDSWRTLNFLSFKHDIPVKNIVDDLVEKYLRHLVNDKEIAVISEMAWR